MDGSRTLAADRRPAPPQAATLRVHVLVDLLWTPQAGGHVKFWERAAAGAAGLPGLDLTVHFAAEADGAVAIGANVRYRLHRPVFSTRRLPFLSHVPDHTDLARFHPGLAAALDGADLIHTTDAYFAFARTAARIARRKRIPLVNSVHTDTPRYTRLYTGATIRRLLGRKLGGVVADRLGFAARAERRMLRRLEAHQALCRLVLAPREEDRARARAVLGESRVRPLPRGMELDRFDPAKRDRAWLQTRFGIAPDCPVVLYAGRVNAGKNVMTLVEALADLAASGRRFAFLCLGEGEDRARVTAALGDRAICPGTLDGEDLARAFASADLLAHPSEIETFANVVIEGLAAGLPVLVSSRLPRRELVRDGATGMTVEGGAAAWARAIGSLLDDPPRRREMGRAARADVERRFRRWPDVVRDELLPAWRAAALGPAA